eukprot:6497525-Pyramimonas_sp.AAC.1
MALICWNAACAVAEWNSVWMAPGSDHVRLRGDVQAERDDVKQRENQVHARGQRVQVAEERK